MKFNYESFCARHPYRIVGEGMPERRFASLLCAARSAYDTRRPSVHVVGPGGGVTTFQECGTLVIDRDAGR
jgi:hypothetical protein